MSGRWSALALISAVGVVAVSRYLVYISPTHENHPFVTISDIWSAQEAADLIAFVEAAGTFPVSADDKTSSVDSIGEATPPKDGACEHPLMTPNAVSGTRAVVPLRPRVLEQRGCEVACVRPKPSIV